MSSLSHDQVRHIATLARLTLTEDEVERYASELTSILGFIEQLGEVDTQGVEPTAQVTGRTSVLRSDMVETDGPSADALLHCSPLPCTEHQIETPSAHG